MPVWKKTFFLPGYECLRPNGSYEPYMPHPAYNKDERINHEGGGITGYMYLKYNDQELEKPSASWTKFQPLQIRGSSSDLCRSPERI